MLKASMIRRLAKKMTPENAAYSAVETLISIVIIFIIIAVLVVEFGAIRARQRDSERKADIAGLQAKIAEYHALHAYYPRSIGELSGLDDKYCKAPGGHGSCVAPDYQYMPLPATAVPAINAKGICDNKKVLCGGYILSTDKMEKSNNPYFVRSY